MALSNMMTGMMCNKIAQLEWTEIELMTQSIKITGTNRDYIEELHCYVNNILSPCENITGNVKFRSILAKKLVVYFYILLLKVKFSQSFKVLNIICEENPNFIDEDNKQKLPSIVLAFNYCESITLHITTEIVRNMNIDFIEKYIVLLMNEPFELSDEDIICTSMLLKRLCLLTQADVGENNNVDDVYNWLRDKYDYIIVCLIILARKLYTMDNFYQNSVYSNAFKMSIRKINIMEITFIKYLNLYISKEDCDNYLNDTYKKFLIM